MYCCECGEKLALVLHAQEGLVPYCKNCGEYRFPQFATAVILTVFNREKNAVLLAKHKGQDDFILFAGYVKKGETAEKAVAREFKEETKLNVVKFKYTSSRYQPEKNLLLLHFCVIAENGDPVPDKSEIEEVKWFDPACALEAVRQGSDAHFFLKAAVQEIKNFK